MTKSFLNTFLLYCPNICKQDIKIPNIYTLFMRIRIWYVKRIPIEKLISDPLPSNSSLLEFYNEVMTFNDSVVELVCCKLDGSPVSVSCGKGLSCAAACYTKEAVLCPSHNCEDCDNVDGVGEGSEERKEEGVKERQGRWSWATQFSGAMSHCTRRGCPVRGRNKYCCFHPICRNRKRRQCSWFQYFLGEWT